MSVLTAWEAIAPPPQSADEHEFYRTPAWVAHSLFRRLQHLIPAPATVLEPCAGDGALLEPLRSAWPAATVDAYDIDPRHEAVRRRSAFVDDSRQRYDLVVTNPPFSHATEILFYGLAKCRAGGHVALLLRLGFLSSQERASLYRTHYPRFVLPLSARPTFRGAHSDPKTDYMWAVWRQGRRSRRGVIEHLDA